ACPRIPRVGRPRGPDADGVGRGGRVVVAMEAALHSPRASQEPGVGMIAPHHLRFMQQLGRSYRELVAGFEVHTGQSMARWRILVLLDKSGPMSQKMLARELGIGPAALTRQLKAMEGDGWVQRSNDPQDA